MSKLTILSATAAVLVVSTGFAMADYRTHSYGGTGGIDARQENQERRIQQGYRSGELTRGEYQRLEAEQARIRDLERNAKSDGYVSAAERARIRNAQDEASRHIYQEKHDSERRGNSYGHGHTHNHHAHRPWWRWY